MGSDWTIVRIGDIADVIGGGTPSSKVPEYWGEEIPWITPKDLSSHFFREIEKGERNISLLGLKKSSTRLLPAKTVLVTSRAPIGYVAIAKNEVCTNQGFKSLILKNDHCPEFFYYLIKFNVPKLEAHSSGSTFKEISGSVFKQIELAIPPLFDQVAIAQILGSLDDKIELNRRMNETLEGMAQALFKSWFVDFDPVIDNALEAGNSIPEELTKRAEIRRKALADGTANREIAKQFPDTFQLTEGMGWIPESWEVKRADEIAKITIGKTPPRKEPRWFSDIRSDNIVWVSIRDMGSFGTFIGDSSEYLTPESVEKFNVRVIPRGSVILSFKLTLGRVSIAQKEITTNEAIAHFVNPKFELTKEFLYCYLSVFDFYSLGSTSSIAIAINSKIVKGMPFIVPNNSSLEEFNRTTSTLFESINNNINQTESLTKLRDTLLPKLISGELRIPDAEKLVEEVL